MKKIIPALAVIAGAAALVAYKLKKDEEKQIVDLDQGLLEDEDDLMKWIWMTKLKKVRSVIPLPVWRL